MPHGTPGRYKNGKCRLECCRTAQREYESDRRRQIAYGRWQPYTPAEPVRAHVRALQAAGVPWRQVATAAGVSQATVNRLLFAKPATGRIRTEAAEQIMAVTASLETISGHVPIDATGTRRRLQALAANGWSGAKIAAYLGIDRTGATRMFTAERVAARKALAVAELYDRLWDQAPPERDRFDRAASTQARAVAVARGWPPPLAWDDDTIDDPDARPHGAHRAPAVVDPIAVEQALAGRGGHLNPAERREAVRIGTARGLSAEELAVLLDTSSRTVTRDRAGAAA